MRGAALLVLCALIGTAIWNMVKPLPAGMHATSLVTRLADSQLEVLDGSSGILARELALIDAADRLIVLDESPLQRETAQHLLLRKRRRPDLPIVVLADPTPELYGGTPAHYLDTLERAGIVVAREPLGRLRDPLPWYSSLWRLGIGWWSDPYAETQPQAGVLASLRRSNAKEDRRQLLVADDGQGHWVAVLPASLDAHLAVAVSGGLARDAAASELGIAAWSVPRERLPGAPPPAALTVGSIDARFLTEGAIRASLTEAFAMASSGDDILISTPALTDPSVLHAALEAAGRGVRLRVLLGARTGAARAVAAELRRTRAPVEVRWLAAAARGSSLTVIRHVEDLTVNVSAADYSHSSLGDLDLSAAVELKLEAAAPAARRFIASFEDQWSRSLPDSATPGQTSAYWRYRALGSAGLLAY